MTVRTTVAALMAGVALGACALAPAVAQAAAPTEAITAAVTDPARPEADRNRDEARKPAEMLAFAQVKPGQRIGEIIPGGGYFTRLFSKAVGPTGKVYGYLSSAAPDRMAAALDPVLKDPAYANTVLLRAPEFAPPESLDMVWTSQNYHDLHNNGGNPAALNLQIFKALKPGGIYIVLDHVATAGSGVNDTSTLHRIDPAAVKAEVLAAGFKFDGESTALHRAEDPHTAKVFEMHDRTDQFIYRFKKPK